VYYDLQDTTCRHQYNQTVVVVPKFALPVELLCCQFKEYVYAIKPCIASLTHTITNLQNAITQSPVAVLHQSLLFVCLLHPLGVVVCISFFVFRR